MQSDRVSCSCKRIFVVNEQCCAFDVQVLAQRSTRTNGERLHLVSTYEREKSRTMAKHGEGGKRKRGGRRSFAIGEKSEKTGDVRVKTGGTEEVLNARRGQGSVVSSSCMIVKRGCEGIEDNRRGKRVKSTVMAM